MKNKNPKQGLTRQILKIVKSSALLLFSLILISEAALAQFKCRHLFTHKKIAGFSLEFIEGELSASEFGPMVEVIQKTLRFFEPAVDLSFTQSFLLLVSRKKDAGIDLINKTLQLSYREILYVNGKMLIKHPNKFLPTIAHELGHLILYSKILYNGVPLLKLKKAELKKVDRKGVLFLSLNELFADLVANVIFKSAKATSDPIFHTKDDKMDRDFALTRNPENREFRKILNESIYENGPYTVLNPSRHYLWKYYFSSAQYPNKLKLFMALLDTYQVILDRHQWVADFMSIREYSEMLNTEFENQLKAHNISPAI